MCNNIITSCGKFPTVFDTPSSLKRQETLGKTENREIIFIFMSVVYSNL